MGRISNIKSKGEAMLCYGIMEFADGRIKKFTWFSDMDDKFSAAARACGQPVYGPKKWKNPIDYIQSLGIIDLAEVSKAMYDRTEEIELPPGTEKDRLRCKSYLYMRPDLWDKAFALPFWAFAIKRGGKRIIGFEAFATMEEMQKFMDAHPENQHIMFGPKGGLRAGKN